VAEVITIPGESIEPPTSGTSLSDDSYLRGIGKLGERLVLLLDLEVVLGLEQQP
jgi:purine-binding chemotaxis protein CheW